jgi:hypothetical protein
MPTIAPIRHVPQKPAEIEAILTAQASLTAFYGLRIDKHLSIWLNRWISMQSLISICDLTGTVYGACERKFFYERSCPTRDDRESPPAGFCLTQRRLALDGRLEEFAPLSLGEPR